MKPYKEKAAQPTLSLSGRRLVGIRCRSVRLDDVAAVDGDLEGLLIGEASCDEGVEGLLLDLGTEGVDLVVFGHHAKELFQLFDHCHFLSWTV